MSHRISITLPADTIRKLDELCDAGDCGRAELIASLIEAEWEEMQTKKASRSGDPEAEVNL
jgi:metal-responsive CopG/Arc/MetJ family transcriptional regulator